MHKQRADASFCIGVPHEFGTGQIIVLEDYRFMFSVCSHVHPASLFKLSKLQAAFVYVGFIYTCLLKDICVKSLYDSLTARGTSHLPFAICHVIQLPGSSLTRHTHA